MMLYINVQLFRGLPITQNGHDIAINGKCSVLCQIDVKIITIIYHHM